MSNDDISYRELAWLVVDITYWSVLGLAYVVERKIHAWCMERIVPAMVREAQRRQGDGRPM